MAGDASDVLVQWVAQGADTLWHFWLNQLGATFLDPGSTLSIAALLCTLLLAAFVAVPRGRRVMPRLKVWRRALFPRRLLRSASGRADFGYFLFGLLFYGLFFGWAALSGAPISAAIAAGLATTFGAFPALGLPAMASSAILTLALFLAYEFAYWLDHYLSHKVPLLWRFHRVHHGAESLSLLTNFRVHPIDTLVFAAIVALVLGSVEGVCRYMIGPGLQPWQVGHTNILMLVAAVAVTHLQHSHLWISFGPKWGRHALGAAHHQIHHSADPRHHDRNFGSTLALWDRLFGTFHMPAARRETLSFGLGEAGQHGWRAALLDPLIGPPRANEPYSAANASSARS